jgi:hypothetical protein
VDAELICLGCAYDDHEHGEVVEADFARQLERELAEAYERAAKLCDEMAARVLSKQDGEPSHPVNVNLRMVALMLPDCADAIRALIAK